MSKQTNIFTRTKEKFISYVFFRYWMHVSKKIAAKRDYTRNPRIVFCAVPIINNKYWSESLKAAGYNSVCLMSGVFAINKKEDFDFYISELCDTPRKKLILKITRSEQVKRYLAFDFALKNYDIFHISLMGGVLHTTMLDKKEGLLIKRSGAKIIINPYGYDNYQYSKIHDPCVRQGLLLSYPERANDEKEIEATIFHWYKYVDCFKPNLAIDGLGRWDILPYNTLAIDLDLWKQKENVNMNDGSNGEVVIAHSPNHRGIKGTEYILQAIDDLKKEGLKIKLHLIEKKTNEEVKLLLKESDILVEQLVFTAYALSGVEGMATGLCVVSNLEDEYYTRIFRRSSFLNECPVVSSSPEKIKDTLRFLIKNPEFRKKISLASRSYVEKYHSYKASQYMFSKIFDKIWFGKKISLLELYHPLNPESYNNSLPKVDHPLVENRIPSLNLNKAN